MRYVTLSLLLLFTGCAGKHVLPPLPAAVTTAAVQESLLTAKTELDNAIKSNSDLTGSNGKVLALNEAAVLSIKQALELLDKVEQEQK